MIFNGEMLLYYQKTLQKSVFSKCDDSAGSVRDYQNRPKIHSFKSLWCSRTIVKHISSIRTHFGKVEKNPKKSIFLLPKNWWKIVNGRFFKKYVSGQNDHLDGPPISPHIRCHSHWSLYAYLTFHFLKNDSKWPIFHVLFENHLST